MLKYVKTEVCTWESQKENYIIDITSIVISTFFGSLVAYMMLLININKTVNMLHSIIGLFAILIIFLLLKKYHPKSDFFTKEIL